MLIFLAIACTPDGRQPHRPGGTAETDAHTGTQTPHTGDSAEPPAEPNRALVGRLIGVAVPEDPALAAWVAPTLWAAPAEDALAFAVDLSTGQGLEGPPLEGSSVQVIPAYDPKGFRTLTEVSPGRYETWPPDRADDDYLPLEGVTLQVACCPPTEINAIESLFPDVVLWAPPDDHPVRTDLEIDVSYQGYQSLGIVVISAAGVITWSSLPDSLEALVASASAPPVTTAVIPGSAFPEVGNYAVGLSGMVLNGPARTSHLVSELSSLQTGILEYWPLQVAAAP